MRTIELTESLFHGAVSLERTGEGVVPWRIPYPELPLFPPDGIGGRAKVPAGVRICFVSDTTRVELGVQAEQGARPSVIDCVVDGQVVGRSQVDPGQESIVFESLPAENKRIDLYLSHRNACFITSLKVEERAGFSIAKSENKRWITYGSSITQCGEAEGPAETWPALVSRKMDWHLTCLGYGGNCHLEPMVARMIRDLPADYLSLCLGINVYGGSSLGVRTFQAAVIGFIRIIREKHPHTPMVVMSPILSPPRETNKNMVDFTLDEMRSEVHLAVRKLIDAGDDDLHVVDGREIFGESDVAHLPDELHPDSQGYRIMADRFCEKVVPLLAGK